MFLAVLIGKRQVAEVDSVSFLAYLLILLLLFLSINVVRLKVYEAECVSEEVGLHALVGDAIHGHRWTRVDFEEPWLLLIIHHDVKAHDLEAVLVVRAHRAQVNAREDDDLLDFCPYCIEVKAAASEIVFQLIDGPFVVVNLIAVLTASVSILIN